MSKPVRLRRVAQRDVEQALDAYLQEAGEETALRFIDALERTYRNISERPRAGSSRFAHELDLPGLRVWSLRKFPYIVFYRVQSDHVDVWRVLHQKRDVPAWLVDNEDP